MRTLGQDVKTGEERANVRAVHEQADVGRHCPALSAAVLVRRRRICGRVTTSAPPTPSRPSVLEQSVRSLVPMRWGLVPRWWTKLLKEIKLATFNARAETVTPQAVLSRCLQAHTLSHSCVRLLRVAGYAERKATVVFHGKGMVPRHSTFPGLRTSGRILRLASQSEPGLRLSRSRTISFGRFTTGCRCF